MNSDFFFPTVSVAAAGSFASCRSLLGSLLPVPDLWKVYLKRRMGFGSFAVMYDLCSLDNFRLAPECSGAQTLLGGSIF